MGLLFQTPVEINELDDRVNVSSDGTLRIRTYGLPMIFWGYLLAILAVIFFMILAIKDPLLKVLNGEDQLNVAIGIAVLIILIGAPLALLCLYFYEKEILKKGDQISVIHKVFFLPLWRKSFTLKEGEVTLELEHFLDSPNVAAQTKKTGMAGFENRGYFKLVITRTGAKAYLVDRNSRRGEMRKLKELLEQY